MEYIRFQLTFTVAHHTNNLNTKKQASEVFTLCIKWPKVLKTLDGQTFGTSFSGRILTL